MVCMITEAASAQHTEVFVTSFHCCASMFSFYSPAGDVDGALIICQLKSVRQPPPPAQSEWTSPCCCTVRVLGCGQVES